jgi:hypothetical protein
VLAWCREVNESKNPKINSLASTSGLGLGENSHVRCPPGHACGCPWMVTSSVAVPGAHAVAEYAVTADV